MNKTAIKNFAVWARKKLIDDITYKAGLIGVTEKGYATPLPQSTKDLQFFDIGTKDYAQVAGKEIKQRDELIKAINEKGRSMNYADAFRAVIEEIAYTWFNRLIAIRFMEVNEYLPSRVRVLSSENPAKDEPDIVTTPFETDMVFSEEDVQEIYHLKEDASQKAADKLFRKLFIAQCNKLQEILPELFEKINDYTELLLNISFTDKDGLIYHLVHDIEEKDFDITTRDEDGKVSGQVEIIGWMYQYYNIVPKDETFALLKKNVKITKERIPAATQLFTPDWIVRYMVENSLGRLWVEGHPNDALKENWKYYLEEAEQEADVQIQLEQIRAEYRNLNPEDIKVIDPCMGSGHILVYCFDVLMQIYESQGYTQREAVQSILENNLYGLDIDKRAAQLAYFAVMMKARQYDRRVLNREIKPHVYAIEESGYYNKDGKKEYCFDQFTLEYFQDGRPELKKSLDNLLEAVFNAKEYGSICNVEGVDFKLLYARFEEIENEISIYKNAVQTKLFTLVTIAEVMARKYHVVVTNPPYMGSGGMGMHLTKYVKDNYADSKSDLFAVFIERCGQMVKKNCYQAMITQHAWMFLSSYEKLRTKMLMIDTVNMAHLGARAFEEIGGEVVQTTSFVLRKSYLEEYKGIYCRLIEPNTQQGKEDIFLAGENQYVAAQRNFSKIPGMPIAYSISSKLLLFFDTAKKVSDFGMQRMRICTGDNNRFLRLWHEVNDSDLFYPNRYVAFSKGGEYRKWYGNWSYVLDYADNGRELKNSSGFSGGSDEYYFKPGLVWTDLSSGKISFRDFPEGAIACSAGPMLYFETEDSRYYLQGYLNSKIAEEYVRLLCVTLHFQWGDIAKFPVIFDRNKVNQIVEIVKVCNKIARFDWDSFETSWDFMEHALVRISKNFGKVSKAEDLFSGSKNWNKCSDTTSPNMKCDSEFKRLDLRNCQFEIELDYTLEDCYEEWEKECNDRFYQLKSNEEELNRIFIDIYGLQDELTPEVEEKDVTVRKADLGRDIRSLISYAVGCMFGRYSLDEPGLAYAGGEWDSSKYTTFVPDKDNCIPITDEAYFEDDMVGQFVGWMKKAFGTEYLEENLDFIAKALGNKGKTSREVIRNYFLSDFIKDHNKIYQKRPIYWLFDSGKQNGFKALVYMHRWDADTVGNLRVEYLHKMQHTYEREMIRMQETIDNSADSREISKAAKRKDKLQKQLKETKDYDAKLAHIAHTRIEIDLDDGVKVNYEKVQTDRDGNKMQILVKI